VELVVAVQAVSRQPQTELLEQQTQAAVVVVLMIHQQHQALVDLEL
jgi:hypothetical protein